MQAGGAEAATRLRPSVMWIGFAGAMSSGAALVVTILTDRPLWVSATFIIVPGFVALVALAVGLRREQQELFLVRVRAGLVAGVLATGAYDLLRWIVEVTGISPTRSFIAIRAFGVGLTDLPATHAGALAAGWAFHACNGIGFAIAYTLVAARRRWVLGIAFALMLEAFMVGLYPGWLNLTLTQEFLRVSILAHVAYGAVLGSIAQRTR
jgi:uncharacterized protein DUF6789